MLLIETVKATNVLRFGRKVHRLGHGALHLERQFVGFDTRAEAFVVGILDGSKTVEFVNELELIRLFLGAHALGPRTVGKRVLRVHGQRHTGVLRAEIVAMGDFTGRVRLGHAHREEAGQIVVQTAQPVMHPGPEAGLRLVQAMAPSVDLILSPVIVVGRPHVADPGDVVGALRQVRPPVRDLDPALAVLLPTDLQRVDDGIDIAHVDRVGGHGTEARLVFGRADRVLERRFVERLSGVLIERGLGVERLHVAVTAAEKNPDDRPCLGWKERLTGGRGPKGRSFARGAGHAVAPEHRAKRQAGEAHANVGEESATRKTSTVTTAKW